MRVTLDIQDHMAAPLMEVLNSLPYVKTKPISDKNAKLLGEMKEAIQELTLIRQGKLPGITAKQLFDEL